MQWGSLLASFSTLFQCSLMVRLRRCSHECGLERVPNIIGGHPCLWSLPDARKRSAMGPSCLVTGCLDTTLPADSWMAMATP